MTRIREDLDGVVTAASTTGMLRMVAGDEIPTGVAVEGALTDTGQSTAGPPRTVPLLGGPLSDAQAARALALGVVVDWGPDYARGFLDGHAAATSPTGGPGTGPAPADAPGPATDQGATGQAPPGQAAPPADPELFDPATTNVHGVETYLSAHPGDFDRVMAAEHAGPGRKGVLAISRPGG